MSGPTDPTDLFPLAEARHFDNLTEAVKSLTRAMHKIEPMIMRIAVASESTASSCAELARSVDRFLEEQRAWLLEIEQRIARAG